MLHCLPRSIAAFVLLLVIAGGCRAGVIAVSPLRLDFDASRSIAAITVTNTGRETVTFEAEALPWPDDAAGQSTSDLVVNPPVATLAPGARKTLRVGLVKRLGAEQERSYRVYVTELPAPRSPDATGIGVRLRVGIPVFVRADAPRELPLQWSAERDGATLRLTASNAGNVHQRVAGLSVLRVDKQFAATQSSSYVLPGRSTAFVVEGIDAHPGEALVIQVQTGETPVRVPVQVP